MSRAGDGKSFLNIADTPAPFLLLGGRYSATFSATWGGGSVTPQILGPDDTTYVAVMTAWTGNGVALVDLPPCTARLLFDFAADPSTDVATAIGDAATALADIEAIGGVLPASIALGQAVLDAIVAIGSAVTNALPGTARSAVTAAQAASAAAQADPTISGDAASMTALGQVDTDLATLATDVAAAPSGVYACLSRIPGV